MNKNELIEQIAVSADITRSFHRSRDDLPAEG